MLKWICVFLVGIGGLSWGEEEVGKDDDFHRGWGAEPKAEQGGWPEELWNLVVEGAVAVHAGRNPGGDGRHFWALLVYDFKAPDDIESVQAMIRDRKGRFVFNGVVREKKDPINDVGSGYWIIVSEDYLEHSEIIVTLKPEHGEKFGRDVVVRCERFLKLAGTKTDKSRKAGKGVDSP
jgi:hypothetical protein